MADLVSPFRNLKIEFRFVDDDTRIQTLKNPKANITTKQVAELNAFIQANNLIVGDKGGATFGKIAKVTSVEGTVTNLDLTS